MDETLRRFIQEALARQVPKPDIEATLLAARWPKDEVRDGLDAFADVEFPIPVPRPKPYVSARDAFTYLILFTLLYLSAWNVGALDFEFIHRTWPDATEGHLAGSSLRTIRWALATLLISFPGYLILSLRVHQATRQDAGKRKSKVRKWLTYLTLFVAVSVLLGDLITLLYNLLEGELTVRFLLKVVVVAAIAGSIFGYYLWELRQDDDRPGRSPAAHPGLRGFIAAVTAAVAIGVLGGFFATGSPGRARGLRLDDRRQTHLEQIAHRIDNFAREFDRLPEDLDTLEQTRGYSLESILDPETGQPYEYRLTGERSYELCARFAAASEDTAESRNRYQRLGASKFWKHPAGRACFAIEVTEPDD